MKEEDKQPVIRETVRLGRMLFTQKEDGSWSGHNGGNQHTGWGYDLTNEKLIEEMREYKQKLQDQIKEIDRKIMVII